MKVSQKGLCFNLYYYMMFNKPKHIKEPHRVGKPSESLRFKNKLVKTVNNSAYESIRKIIEEGDNVASHPQLEKQNNEHFKSHKKYFNKTSKQII